MGKRQLEICVDDLAGLAAAEAGGADRIELCSALALGGLTPSPALVARAVGSGLPVHAMVRPRPGDFVYDEAEIALMADDIARLAGMGVAGIVTGISHADGRIDVPGLTRLRAAAPNCLVVLHRAIDLAPDPIAAIRDACAAGMDCVLSSGGATSAPAGAATLATMVAAAGADIIVIGAAGITAANVAALIRATGLSQIHASASGTGEWRTARIEALGFAAGPPRRTTAARVAALKQAVDAA